MLQIISYIFTLNIRLDTFCPGGCRQWCVLLCSLGSFESSNIILSSPVSDTPSSLHKSEKKIIGYLFIWTIIFHSFTLVIDCCKCAVLSILVICKDITTFLTYGLFVIIHLLSFFPCQVRSSRRTRVSGFLSLFFIFLTPLEKNFPS